MLRRTSWRWIAVAALALVTSAAALPAAASATVLPACPVYASAATDVATIQRCNLPMPAYRTAGLDHVGWTYLNLNYCPPRAMCALAFRQSIAAWRWDGRAWSQTSLDGGWVYVYPYSGEWRWAWTQRTGWVAVSGGRFELR